jgi:hypothetical protein
MLTIPGFQPMNPTAPHIESAVESKTYVKNAQIRRNSSYDQEVPSGSRSVGCNSMGSMKLALIARSGTLNSVPHRRIERGDPWDAHSRLGRLQNKYPFGPFQV